MPIHAVQSVRELGYSTKYEAKTILTSLASRLYFLKKISQNSCWSSDIKQHSVIWYGAILVLDSLAACESFMNL
jgi:hypothetical protein